MPCDQIILNKVEFTLTNLDLTLKAIKAEFGVDAMVAASGNKKVITFIAEGRSVTLTNGKAMSTHQGYTLGAILDRLRQGVSRQAVKLAATKYGWKLQEQDATHFQIVKRSF